MNAAKELQVDEFTQWLMDKDIAFLTRPNGHIQILDEEGDKILFQIYVTTERLITNPSDVHERDTVRGMSNIKEIVENTIKLLRRK